MVKRYDAGLLNDYGGGNVEWWQDYIRAEIDHCNDYWEDEIAALRAELAEKERETDLLTKMVEIVSRQCTILNNKLSLYRRAVGPVREFFEKWPGVEILVSERKRRDREAYMAVRDCIRILGESEGKGGSNG